MPCARQAKAPCVLVCESPHTTVMPGSVAPCSGPDDVHDALALVEEREVDLGAELAHVGVERLDLQPGETVAHARHALLPMLGRRVVVGGRDHGVHAPGLAPGELQALDRPAGW